MHSEEKGFFFQNGALEPRPKKWRNNPFFPLSYLVYSTALYIPPAQPATQKYFVSHNTPTLVLSRYVYSIEYLRSCYFGVRC